MPCTTAGLCCTTCLGRCGGLRGRGSNCSIRSRLRLPGHLSLPQLGLCPLLAPVNCVGNSILWHWRPIRLDWMCRQPQRGSHAA